MYVHVARSGPLTWLGAHKRRPHEASWAPAAQDAPRDFHAAVETAKAAGHDRLADTVSAELHQRWRHAYLVGLAQNTGQRTSHNKRHAAWAAAEMLKKRTGEILLFTTRFDAEWTNNPAERALRMVKLQMAVGSYWHRVATAQWYCTVHSYLDTARTYGADILDALRGAFTGNPWMPPTAPA